MSKLSEELVEKIRSYYNEGNSCQKTADKFGVGKTTVRSYVSIRPKKVSSDKERKANAVKAVQRRRLKVKEMAVTYLGGSCNVCGYDKYQGALDFHHIDPDLKEFSISSKGHCRSWEKVKKELDKCLLVCANCHREIHGKIIKT